MEYSMKEKSTKGTVLQVIGVIIIIVGLPAYLFIGDLAELVFIVGALLFASGIMLKHLARVDHAEKILAPEIEKAFPDATYNYMADYSSDNGSEVRYFANVNIICTDRNMELKNYLKTAKFMHVQLEAWHDSDNAKVNGVSINKRSVTFNGTLVKIKADTGIKSVVRILCSEKDLLGEKTFVEKNCIRTIYKVETGNIEFDRTFEVFAGNQHEAFFVLNAFVVEKLLELRKMYGKFAMAVMSDEILITFNEHELFFKEPTSKDFDSPMILVQNAKQALKNLTKALDDIADSISRHVKESK